MKKFFLTNYKTIITTLVLVAVLAVPLVMPMIASAALGGSGGDIDTNLKATKLDTSLGSTKELPETIGDLITVVLGFLGIVFIIIILYAGFIWLTSNGDDAKIKKAKGMIINSIIAVVIIFLAYAITTFVLNTIIGKGILGST